MAQALLVDAVADARRHVPLDRHLERGQRLRALEQRLHRDQIVLVAVDQQHRRLALISPATASGLASSGSTKMPE